MIRILVCIALLVFVIGCSLGEPRIDASSPESLKETYQAMMKSLPEPEQEKLKKATLQIAMSAITPTEDGPLLAKLNTMAAMAKDPQLFLGSVGAQIEGKSAAEIIALGDRLRRTRTEDQLQKARTNIADAERELKANEDAYSKSTATLASVKVEGARYYWSTSGYRPEPVIAFTITNNGTVALKQVSFRGVVETPGRSVSWIDEAFSYDVSGGLEPGESKKLELAPNRFGPWGNAELYGKKDLVLSVRVTNFTGADGVAATETSEDEIKALRERIAALKAAQVQLEAELKPVADNSR